MENKPLRPGDYIYSAAAIPSCGSRSFIVRETDTLGNITTSPARPPRGMLQPGEIRTKLDSGKDVYVQLSTTVQMSSKWPVLKQPRAIEEKSLSDFQTQCQTIPVESSIQADDPTHFEKDLWEQVQDLYTSFQADPNVFLEYLEFSSRFYQYSARNQAMIYKQAPDSTFVTSRQRWAELGYQVHTEHLLRDIKIMRPQERTFFQRDGRWVSLGQATPKERELLAQNKIEQYKKLTFVQMSVYDISQTNCPIEDYPSIYAKGQTSAPHKQLFDAAKRVAELEGISVTTEDVSSISLGGYYDRMENRIVISDKEQDTRKAIVMLHEYSHALLHNTCQPTIPTAVKEFEAQTLAVKLMQHYGFEIDNNEKNYILTYLERAVSLGDGFELDKSLERINKQFSHADDRISSQLEWVKAQELQHNAQIGMGRPIMQQSTVIQENFLQGL